MSKIPQTAPFIIGAGGVASYLLPVLMKVFPITQLWLRDADVLETKNLDRQLFDLDQVGQKKAEALLKKYSDDSDRCNALADCRWFAEGDGVPDNADLIICVADNHTARRAALQAAEQKMIPCIIAGNDYYDSQAMWVRPQDHYSKIDPKVKYPDIATNTDHNPIRCTGEAQESSPQLALANYRCASHIMDLMWLHLVVTPDLPEESKAYFPHEIHTAINRCTYLRYNDDES